MNYIISAVLATFILIAVSMWGIPQYGVYSQGLRGEAELARAEQNRQIRVEAAQAELDASVLIAQSIEVLGESAKAYPEYREQEFIAGFSEALREGTIDQIIYVPTEANIPILEAGKR